MGTETQPQETYYSPNDPPGSHGRAGADRGAEREIMSNNRDRHAALWAIRDVLAADCACAPHDFLAGGHGSPRLPVHTMQHDFPSHA
jgi:hypothetical protein